MLTSKGGMHGVSSKLVMPHVWRVTATIWPEVITSKKSSVAFKSVFAFVATFLRLMKLRS